ELETPGTRLRREWFCASVLMSDDCASHPLDAYRLRGWVRRADVIPALRERAEVRFPDGTGAALEPGLAARRVEGADGGFRFQFLGRGSEQCDLGKPGREFVLPLEPNAVGIDFPAASTYSTSGWSGDGELSIAESAPFLLGGQPV